MFTRTSRQIFKDQKNNIHFIGLSELLRQTLWRVPMFYINMVWARTSSCFYSILNFVTLTKPHQHSKLLFVKRIIYSQQCFSVPVLLSTTTCPSKQYLKFVTMFHVVLCHYMSFVVYFAFVHDWHIKLGFRIKSF